MIRLGELGWSRHNGARKEPVVLRVMTESASDAVAANAASGAGSLSARLLAAALVLAILAGAALAVDLPVAHYVKAHQLRGELSRVVRLSEVFGWGGTVAIIILSCVVLDRRGWRVFLPLAIPSLGAGLLADGVKLLVGRWRPSAPGSFSSASETFIGWLPLLDAGSATGSRHPMQSFPSAHAATAAGLAAALALLYPRGRWLFAVFALLAMIQRVETHAHYCSDVLAGAALGLAVSAVTTRWHEVRSQRSEVGSPISDLGLRTSSGPVAGEVK
jgi:membrane-associated phospholipid phosphatase